MQIPYKCFTKRTQRQETILQNYPPHAKNALQNTINIDREHPWLCCPKTFILLTVYMQHSLSFLHPYWGDAKGLLSTGTEGGWGKDKAKRKGQRIYPEASYEQPQKDKEYHKSVIHKQIKHIENPAENLYRAG